MESRLEYSLPVILKPKPTPEIADADADADVEPRIFAKGEDIDVSPGIVFVDEMLEVQPTDPRREYYERWKYGDKPSYLVHWGQRKLLLNEIAFLTYFWDPQEVPNPVIVYVGAAAGDHIPILQELFPQIDEMHLYDPSPFSISPTDKILIYNQLFTNKDAEVWSDRDDIFFISDIRVRNGDYSRNKPVDNERGILEDNQRQRSWVEIIDPVHAHLKFRTPFPISEEFYEMEYFDGPTFYQPWAPVESAETRLIPTKAADGRYKTKIWDSKKHEEQLFYHNTVSRDNLLYSNPFLEAPNDDPIDPPELLNDYDSVAEAVILRDYLEKIGKKADGEAVIALSRYITKRLNEQGRMHKTIDSIRSFVASGKKKRYTSGSLVRGRGRGRSRGGRGRKVRGRGKARGRRGRGR